MYQGCNSYGRYRVVKSSMSDIDFAALPQEKETKGKDIIHLPLNKCGQTNASYTLTLRLLYCVHLNIKMNKAKFEKFLVFEITFQEFQSQTKYFNFGPFLCCNKGSYIMPRTFQHCGLTEWFR